MQEHTASQDTPRAIRAAGCEVPYCEADSDWARDFRSRELAGEWRDAGPREGDEATPQVRDLTPPPMVARGSQGDAQSPGQPLVLGYDF